MITINRVLVLLVIFLFNTLTLSLGKEDWKEYRSTHFYVYSKDVPEEFIQSVEEAAERYYVEITQNLGFTRYENWSYDKRAKIYIYKDQEDYIDSAQQAGWSHGAADAENKVIRTFPSAHGFFDSTLPHELGHIIFGEFIDFRPVPVWFNEGVAMYQEKAKRWGAHKHVKKTMTENKFIPLSELSRMFLGRNSNKELVELYYAEAASIVYYMIAELGQYRFVNLCRKIKDGQTFEQALTSTYTRFRSLEDLNRAWVSYLESQ